MSAPLPLTFKLASLPDRNWNPQQWADALVARLSAESDIAIAFFTTGAVMPTSDTGPWLKDGREWWIWDITLGTYIPAIIPQSSLKWAIQASSPDPLVYTFWIEVDGSGKAQDILTYYSGAWHPIFEDTLALYYTAIQTDAQITAALTTLKHYPFKARKVAIAQSLTAGSGEAQVVLENEAYDPDSVFGSNIFTAPIDGYYHFDFSVSISLDSGTPVTVDINVYLRRNGASVAAADEYTNDDTSGKTYKVSTDLLLSAGDTVDSSVEIVTGSPSVWDLDNDDRRTYLSGFLIEKL